MTVTRRTLQVMLLVLLCVPGAAAQDFPSDGRWVPLFNGRDLDGWTPKIRGYEAGDNFGDTFRVDNGILKVSYDRYDAFDNRFGHLFYKDTFSSYFLRVEYRFVGQQAPGGADWALRNSGVMFHGQSPRSMRRDQDFPVSVEAQFLGGIGRGERHTANVCSPGTHIVMNGALVTRHCNDSTSKTYDGDQWVTVVLEVRGNGRIRHFVNGELVLEYEQPQLDDSVADAKALIVDGNRMLGSGTISLQAESHPVEFRTVEIMVLKE